MASQVTNYKCPVCTGPLHFVGASGQLECDYCLPRGQSIRLRRGKVHYALLPVWMLHTKWNGKDFLFAMNGQTGRLVGDLPMSWGRFWSTFAAIAVPAAAIATVIASLF